MSIWKLQLQDFYSKLKMDVSNYCPFYMIDIVAINFSTQTHYIFIANWNWMAWYLCEVILGLAVWDVEPQLELEPHQESRITKRLKVAKFDSYLLGFLDTLTRKSWFHNFRPAPLNNHKFSYFKKIHVFFID